MPATPKRAGKKPRGDSRFPSDVLAVNVRSVRSLRRLTQTDLAERMVDLGWEKWSRAAVSEVERSGRSVTVDELFALAAALETTVAVLLDPMGIEGRPSPGVDFGGPEAIPAVLARDMVRAREPAVLIEWDGNRALRTILMTMAPGKELDAQETAEALRQYGKEEA